MRNRITLILLSLWFSTNIYSQIVRDSLVYFEQQLNLEFLMDTKEFYEGKDYFVITRVNDSLSDEKNSYSYYYSKDSCTHGGSVYFDTNYIENGSKYRLLHGMMGFAYSNGKSDCVNHLLSEDYLQIMEPYLKSEEVYVKHSDLTQYDYTIYGRIGGKYIYEVFNSDYPLDPKNSKFQEFINLFIMLYDDSDFGE